MAFPVKDKYLLINGLSGAVKLVSKKTAQKYFDEKVTEELKPFFTHLTPEEEYEKAKSFSTFLMEKATECADGTIAVTYDCNLRCPYCYEIWAKKPETKKTVMDKYKVDKAFEALEELNKNCSGKKPLVLTGGEPLMKKNKDIVKYILEKGSDLGYTFTVFTNGVELSHFLTELSLTPVAYVQITLDGPRSLHDRRRVFKKTAGTFDTIVKNIEKAREKIPMVIRTNADPEILSRIDELASFYRERGWIADPNIRFSLVYECDQRTDPEIFDQTCTIYEEILDLLRREELSFFEAYPFRKLYSIFSERPRFWPAFWNCNAVIKRYVFDPFGDIYPCRGMLGWKKERIGQYIPELSFNERYDQWRNHTLFTVDSCADCEIALLCAGGCGYASLVNTGDLSTPVCTATKRIVERYLEYLYEKRML